jgi:DNA-directed RNA polymerase specialized sigma24 family protein
MSEGVILWSTGTSRTNGERGDGMTQDELKEIPIFAKQIDKHLDRLKFLKAKSTSVPAMQTSERVQTSVIDRSMVVADSIVDLEREIDAEKKELDRMRKSASQFFALHDLTLEERELLDYRYIYCYTWEEVASLLHVGERTARWRHSQVMEKLFPES